MNRIIRFRAWVIDEYVYSPVALFDTMEILQVHPITRDVKTVKVNTFEEFTGLLDKSGLTDVYEGDIIDKNGLVKGNVYESPQIFKEGTDHIIEKMGTAAWRGSESIAMGRGCKYSK